MAKLLLLSLSLTLVFLFHGCIAQIDLPQQPPFRTKTGQCRFEQLSAREPSHRFQYEAGVSEYWDSNNEEFQCAGIEFVRHVIQPKGLLLPYYTNSPKLAYILQGSGIHGTVIPGCAETYGSESSYSSFEEQRGSRISEGEREGEQGRRSDRHQKLTRFRRGDVLALPQGFTHWAYNDGDTPIIAVEILDVANQANQLDSKFRQFFLAGNPNAYQSQGQQGEQTKRSVLFGFDQQLLVEAFNINPEIVRRLESKEDNRGAIVRAENLKLVFPEWGREEQSRGGRGYNGIEETLCSFKIRQNIDHPSKADIYNPSAGRLTTLNSHALPILSFLRLSAERGVLYRNAIMSPHWSTNSHSAVYVTKGSARIQVVSDQGRAVFDGQVNQGQLLVVPQNFVVLKKASNEGFEWVTFKTNDNALSSQLAGRLSAIRGLPEEVLMNSYGISRENAKSLKYNREEAELFSPGSRSGRYD